MWICGNSMIKHVHIFLTRNCLVLLDQSRGPDCWRRGWRKWRTWIKKMSRKPSRSTTTESSMVRTLVAWLEGISSFNDQKPLHKLSVFHGFIDWESMFSLIKYFIIFFHSLISFFIYIYIFIAIFFTFGGVTVWDWLWLKTKVIYTDFFFTRKIITSM